MAILVSRVCIVCLAHCLSFSIRVPFQAALTTSRGPSHNLRTPAVAETDFSWAECTQRSSGQNINVLPFPETEPGTSFNCQLSVSKVKDRVEILQNHFIIFPLKCYIKLIDFTINFIILSILKKFFCLHLFHHFMHTE